MRQRWRSELIGLYGDIACPMSIAVQCSAFLEKLGDLLADGEFERCGPISHYDPLNHYSSFPVLIGQHPLVKHCAREDLVYV